MPKHKPREYTIERIDRIKNLLNKDEFYKIPIDKSYNNKIPALWETGGGLTRSGFAFIVSDEYFQKKSPLYIKTKGVLSNNNHALIPIDIEDHVVDYEFHINVKSGILIENIILGTVIEIDKVNNLATIDVENIMEDNEWWYDDVDGESMFYLPLKTAREKSDMYHCRVPLYVYNRGINLKHGLHKRKEILV